MSSKGSGFIQALIGAILGSVITMLVISQNILPFMQNINPNTQNNNPQTTSINVEGDNPETIYKAVVQKAMPSVVGITTVSTQNDFFFGARQTSGVGTGVIVDERGYILTNSHVVDDGTATSVTVLFYDGSKQEAKVLWNEKALDLAVIKVEKTGLPVAELGDSDTVEVGDISVAIGNPLGLEFERSVTQGIISGLNRSIQISETESIDNLIQTDASINPGNSGGPLLNSKGQVIAINSAKISSAEGLGFAIPINIAKPIVDQFIEKGEFQRVYLGIRGIDVDYYKQATGANLNIETGIYIASVEPGSAAEKAGLKEGDVLVKFDGKDMNQMSKLVRELYTKRPGDSASVEIFRDGKTINVDITF